MRASEIDRIAGEDGTTLEMGDLMDRAESQERASWKDIPTRPGIYAVHLPDGPAPSFAASAGSARYATPKGVGFLRDKWRRITANGPTDILYIGKAGGRRGLRQRVRELARFGVGHPGHRGGKWLWQVKEIAAARVLMRCCPGGREAALESELLCRFRSDHGDWPLANRTAGAGGQTAPRSATSPA